MHPAHETSKNLDIQVLRSVAILLVVGQHFKGRLPTPDWYLSAFAHIQFWSGVDVFFAISGYLICQTFLRGLKEASSPASAVRSFWIRRGLRLLPALYFWLAFSVACAFVLDTVWSAGPAKVFISALTAVGGVSNLYWAHCVQTGIAACGNPDFNGVTWSLSLEWQFYALLSTLLLVCRRNAAVVILAGIALTLSFAPPNLFSYPWSLRPAAFALGALIFVAQDSGHLHVERIPRAANRLLLALGITICLLAPLQFPKSITLLSVGVGGALCLLSALRGNSYSQRLGGRVLCWIGERSYSIYLCHLPCILIVHQIVERLGMSASTPKHVALAVILTALLVAFACELSYRLIERRWMSRRAAAERPDHQTSPA